MDSASSIDPTQDEVLVDLVRRLASESPQLTDLSPSELERLAKVVVVANLRDDLQRMIDLAKIDGEAEVKKFLTVASRTGSWATTTAYAHGLARLDDWACRNGHDVLNLTPRQADEYILTLRESGRSPGTIRLDVAGPSSFFSFLERRYRVIRNPFRGTRALPANRPVREIVIPTDDELDVVLASARPWLRAAIICMSHRGLRVGALPTLVFVGDVYSGWSKGKAILGRMPAVALEAIQQADLNPRRPFLGWESRQIGEVVWHHSWRLARKGRVREAFSSHDYRHYFAVTEYRHHRDLYRLKELLGHAMATSTERYLRSLKVL